MDRVNMRYLTLVDCEPMDGPSKNASFNVGRLWANGWTE